MSLYKQFKTDENVEQQGIILQYGENSSGKPIEIRIARAGGSNHRFAKVLEAKTKPYRRQIQNDAMGAKQAESIMKEVYAETVVLGWSNIDLEESENGPAIENAPFNSANCIRLFNDLPDFWEDVKSQATKAALFRADILEADSKN